MVTDIRSKQHIEPERSYLRPTEIVARTGLSKGTVFAALYAGELKGYRVGRAWLVPVEALDQWIRGGDADVAA